MLQTRIIPVLLYTENGLYKTEKFNKPKYIGDPLNTVRIFNEKEVDELIVLDIEASKKQQEPNYALIEDLASECFMPVCYGGGITNIKQMQTIFSLGIEKIALNIAALKDLSLVREATQYFGSQSIVVAVDIKKNLFGKYSLFNHCTKKYESKNLLFYLQEIQNAGAGELLLNNVDLDGTQKGYDYELIRLVASKLSIPIIALGGASSVEDFLKATQSGASACAAGSMFVFHGKHKAVLITYPDYLSLESILKDK